MENLRNKEKQYIARYPYVMSHDLGASLPVEDMSNMILNSALPLICIDICEFIIPHEDFTCWEDIPGMISTPTQSNFFR